MRTLNKIIVHCSATPETMDIGVKEIRAWHKEKGWSDIGYHFVIRRDGTVEKGRDIQKVGAHVKYHNLDSVGICLVGGTDANNKLKAEANFSFKQYKSLIELIKGLKDTYGDLSVSGHRDWDKGKECPCFDVKSFIA